MDFELLDGWSPEEWNAAIALCETALVYHDSAWLQFLEEAGRGGVVRWRLVEGGRVEGYFPAVFLRRGPFRLLGSPLAASMSEHMGPVAGPAFRVESFLEGLDRLCRSLRIHQLEIGSPLFDPDVMRRHGYEVRAWNTLRVPLSRDEGAMWAGLTGKARNRIRRGLSSGLLVRDAESPAFLETHVRQLTEVYGQHGLAPPFSAADYRALVARLSPRGLVLTLEVIRPETSEVLATGIFPCDRRRVYSLSTASRLDARPLYPNELLHWTVMKLAGQRGIAEYRMGDAYRAPATGGRFKEKFNGTREPVYRFVRHYSALARYSRAAYIAFRRLGRRLRLTPGQEPASP